MHEHIQDQRSIKLLKTMQIKIYFSKASKRKLIKCSCQFKKIRSSEVAFYKDSQLIYKYALYRFYLLEQGTYIPNSIKNKFFSLKM